MQVSCAWFLDGCCWSDSPSLGHSQLEQISHFLTIIKRYVEIVFKTFWAKCGFLVTGFVEGLKHFQSQQFDALWL